MISAISSSAVSFYQTTTKTINDLTQKVKKVANDFFSWFQQLLFTSTQKPPEGSPIINELNLHNINSETIETNTVLENNFVATTQINDSVEIDSSATNNNQNSISNDAELFMQLFYPYGRRF